MFVHFGLIAKMPNTKYAGEQRIGANIKDNRIAARQRDKTHEASLPCGCLKIMSKQQHLPFNLTFDCDCTSSIDVYDVFVYVNNIMNSQNFRYTTNCVALLFADDLILRDYRWSNDWPSNA